MASQQRRERVATLVFVGSLAACASRGAADRVGWDRVDFETERRCRTGERTSCRELGDRLITHTDRDKDLERGMVLLEVACGQDDLAACATLAGVYAKVRPGSPRALARARQLATQACQGRLPAACTQVGEIALFEDRRNRRQASQAFQQGCQLGDARGCELRGTIESRNVLSGDEGVAEQAFAAACGMGRWSSCHRLAMSRLEKPDTRAGAVDLLTSNCEHRHAPSCSVMALLTAPVLVAHPSCSQAQRFAEKACELKDEVGCTLVDVCRLSDPGKAEAALGRLREGCDQNDGLACLFWADHQDQRGPERDKAEPDLEAVRRAYRVACRGGSGVSSGSEIACARLVAIDLERATTATQAEAALSKLREACEEQIGEACCVLADEYRAGRWVPVDASTERTLRTRACDLGCERCCR